MHYFWETSPRYALILPRITLHYPERYAAWHDATEYAGPNVSGYRSPRRKFRLIYRYRLIGLMSKNAIDTRRLIFGGE